MAKGNDGNYLQHSLEVETAVRLASLDPERRLHVALAHGMKPFEPCEHPSNPPARALLLDALKESYAPPKADESIIVSAYRGTKASLTHYPNSAELLRYLIGSNRLSGGISEVDPEKYKEIREAWQDSRIFSVNSSWRCQVGSSGTLFCPANLETPWLITLDPMTYCEEGYIDDDKLYRADLKRLSSTLSSYVATDKPGVAALFVYAVRPDVCSKFWSFIDDLAALTETSPIACWVTHRGGNRNLAALLCSRFEFPVNALPKGLKWGRD